MSSVNPFAGRRSPGRRIGIRALGSCVTVLGLLAASAAVAGPLRPQAAPGTLNDTGLLQCLSDDRQTVTTACAGSNQDASDGRDVAVADDSDGKAGFSYLKLAETGEVLPGNAATWSCVLDQVTGLMWENKTEDWGARDHRWRYTSYGDGRPGDTSSYVTAVNATGMCGFTDWRLPSRDELHGLADYGRAANQPAIEATYFPHTAYENTWTGTPYVAGSNSYWAVGFSRRLIIYQAKRTEYLAVRLVRGDAPPVRSWVIQGDEVLDRATGLIWRRCAEGQVWDGSTCSGTPKWFYWPNTVKWVRKQIDQTGLPWRVPNPKEMDSIVDKTRQWPSIDTQVFPDSWSVRMWTSSIEPEAASGAYFVNFQTGAVADHDRAREYGLRLVRTAPP